ERLKLRRSAMFIVLDCSLDLSRAFLSFTPGFNRVTGWSKQFRPTVSTVCFERQESKPLKRFPGISGGYFTRLKPGVNESSRRIRDPTNFHPGAVTAMKRIFCGLRLVLPIIFIAFLSSASLHAQTQPPDPPAGFNRIEQMVPMRDGVKLHTIIYAPKSHRDPLPILFNRTPYGIDNIYRGF